MPALSAILGSLDAAREDELPNLAPIEESYRDPDPFWAMLATAHTALGVSPPKSRMGDRYDLYHDLILRHRDTRRAALRWYERATAKGWKSLTYAELDARCAVLAATWSAQGVKPGEVIAIVLMFGADATIAMLAALRLGACISLLPPIGGQWLVRRLAELAPAHLVTTPAALPLVGALAAKALTDTLPALHVRPMDTSYTYMREDPCAQLFSPLRPPLTTPVPLTAHDAYRLALRDAALTYLLRAGDQLAAPDFHPAQHQPALLFATLLAGATFVHIPFEALAENPALLREQPLRCLGVTPRVRERLIETPAGRLKHVHHWFKNPEERLEFDRWRMFVSAHGLDRTPVSNVVIDAAAGGAVLTSVRRPASLHAKVIPAAGLPCRLADLLDPERPSSGEAGLFFSGPQAAAAKKPPPDAYMLLARAGCEYFYIGTYLPRRAGRVYPTDEVLEALADLPELVGASVVAAPRGSAPSSHDFVLLLFTGAAADSNTSDDSDRSEAAVTDAVTRTITLRMGAEHLPDRIEVLPLYPRRPPDKPTAIDHAACAALYLSGSLARRARSPAVRRLTALRHLLTEEGGSDSEGGAGSVTMIS